MLRSCFKASSSHCPPRRLHRTKKTCLRLPKVRDGLCRQRQLDRSLDINSDSGRLVVFVGFFIFVGVVIAFALAGATAQKAYRRGLTRMHPLGCTAAAFVVLLLVALIRDRI